MTKKIFDSHLHIIDPDFPLQSNNGFTPEPFTVEDYQVRTGSLGVAGGAVASGSFQAFDQSYLIDALQKLGPGFVGVTQLPESVSDAQLQRLDAHGVRAVRFNVKRGGSESVRYLKSFAERVFDLVDWHVELYVDSVELPELEPVLSKLPAVSIDHLGLSKAGLPALLRLVERGVKVKATGFGRVDFSVEEALQAIFEANPTALMFGTDLPSTRAPRPFLESDVNLVMDTLGHDAAEAVLWKNAVEFYRLSV